MTESVTVEATAPMLKTESSEQSYNIANETIVNLPMAVSGGTRSALNTIILSPGVAGTSGSGGRINGETGNTMRVLVDGQDTTNSNAGAGLRPRSKWCRSFPCRPVISPPNMARSRVA